MDQQDALVMMKNKKAQAIIEFCFSCIILVFLFYGLVAVVRWVMLDLATRRYNYDTQFSLGGDAASQLGGDFHRMRPLDAVVNVR